MATPHKKFKAKKHDGAEPDRTGAMRPDEMPPDVLEFIRAMDHYKRTHERPFPNWSEVLEVLKTLGYARDRSTVRP